MALNRITTGGPYIWESSDWPLRLRWEPPRFASILADCRRAQGRLAAKAGALGLRALQDLEVVSLTDDAVTTSRIEGEGVEPASVRSSIAHHLGLPQAGLPRRRRHIDGLVGVLLDARRRSGEPLSTARLLRWHADLFPTAAGGPNSIGAWRVGDAPMQVVSGVFGKSTVHFEGPPSDRVPQEMTGFIRRCAEGWGTGDVLVQAGVAHLAFVTIHPFDDGNGRIGRAIADLFISRDEHNPQRLWSLCAQIERERSQYYAALQAAQKGDGDLTGWLEWFLGCVHRAMQRAESTLDEVLLAHRFWALHQDVPLNARQRKILGKLLDAGPQGFIGGMTTRKAASMTGASRATAQRDLADLVDQGVLQALPARGRSAAYQVVWPSRESSQK